MKKSIVLVVVIGVMTIISILILVALHLMSQESRLAEHKIRRMRAFFAAQAGIVHALERLREGAYPNPGDGETISVGNPADQGYPINVYITVGGTGIGAPPGTRPVTTRVNY